MILKEKRWKDIIKQWAIELLTKTKMEKNEKEKKLVLNLGCQNLIEFFCFTDSSCLSQTDIEQKMTFKNNFSRFSNLFAFSHRMD